MNNNNTNQHLLAGLIIILVGGTLIWVAANQNAYNFVASWLSLSTEPPDSYDMRMVIGYVGVTFTLLLGFILAWDGIWNKWVKGWVQKWTEQQAANLEENDER